MSLVFAAHRAKWQRDWKSWQKKNKNCKKKIIIITATIFITVDSGKESGQQNILDSKKQ